jgi:hypothetical protein
MALLYHTGSVIGQALLSRGQTNLPQNGEEAVMSRYQGVQDKISALLSPLDPKAGLIIVLICGIPFFTFTSYYFLAPWEVAYRQHAAAVYRAQVEALPPYNTSTLRSTREGLSVRSRDGLSVLASYICSESCDSALDYYRQIAPAHGWTYLGKEPPYSDSTDHYTGVFEGYQADLEIGRDSLGYSLYVRGPTVCWWSCPPPPQETLPPNE